MTLHATEVRRNVLYICRIPRTGIGSNVQHILAYLRSVNDGGMFEFVDPVSDGVVGCVGREKVGDFVTPLSAFTPSVDALAALASLTGRPE